jgi:hypothetical protein
MSQQKIRQTGHDDDKTFVTGNSRRRKIRRHTIAKRGTVETTATGDKGTVFLRGANRSFTG